MASRRFQNALKRVPQNVPPIWMMRQAGRYHSHYQKLREMHSFVDLCRIPELAAEAARGPVADFDFDLAILFSDLLFPLESLGLGLSYGDAGPHLDPHLDATNIDTLRSVEEAFPGLEFQREAVRCTREVLPAEKSLIGFVGGPWTLFVYAVEGSHKGNLIDSKCSPALYRKLCEKLVPLLIENIRLQFDGGAEVVMVLDTAAGEVSPSFFQHHLLGDLATIIGTFPGRVGYYARGIQPAHLATPTFEAIPVAGIGVDWRWSLIEALSLYGGRGFVQGNFDPSLLFLSPEDFETELRRFLDPLLALSPEERRGWVCGLGHGILPRTPEDNVRTFIRTVRELFS